MNPSFEVLAVMRMSPLLEPLLRAQFTVHDRLHESDPAAFEAVAPRIRGIAASGESRVGAELMDRLPALEIISVMGVGYDGIDVAAAKARGVVVTHTPDVLNDDVADLALGLMLAASRQLVAADRHVREGRWAAQGPMPLARKLSGSRLGILGMGRIGQAIARRALAFDMTVAYHTRTARTDVPYPHVASAVELAAQSDVLCVITPGGAATRHLVNAEVMAALGPQGLLVNVARGSVVDEAALIEALESGALGGAALDVFADEPNVPERLRALPQVVLTPHIGSATNSTRGAMAGLAAGNLRAKAAREAVVTAVPECR
ncbi:MAG: 2-hydroxyacid dehydrogenase [Sphaerotilus sp.]|nr:2-hydroxyacid dehydrogenase [Sphaerotilus sp.]MDZ7856514.1 2-hydroxyacid dehydrogenase [Sphaerotilus sp.]